MVTEYPADTPLEESQTQYQQMFLTPEDLWIPGLVTKFLGLRATQDVMG